jgi:cob(I)alamin adenosyltransferase
LRVSAYGTVDEANAAIGVARLHLTQGADENLSAMLARIQNDLFDLGADLCRPEPEAGKQESSGTALRVLDSQVERLEREIDSMNARLSPLNSFVLPGGKPAAAYLHMARTIVRRAEREMTLLAERESVSPAAIRYVNRLSDHLFVAARFANDLGAKDVLWQPGATRSL